MHTLVSASDYATLWAFIAAGTALAIWLEQKYRWAARLSGPVLALIVAMTLSNLHVLPTESPAYDFVTDWLVPLAIPLLLCRANLREIIRTGGRVFLIFHISSLGTLIGTLVAFRALRSSVPSPDLEHAAGMMAASYIGGGVNFMAVKASYRIAENVANPLIVADNFVMAGVFVALVAIAGHPWFRARFPHPHSEVADTNAAAQLTVGHWQRKGIGMLDLARALAFAFGVVALSRLVGTAATTAFDSIANPGPGLQMLRVLCTNPFVLITAVTLAFATVLAKPLSHVNGPEQFGSYFLSVFLFTLGLPADLGAVVTQAPIYFVFCGIIALINLSVTLALGKVLRLNLEELLLVVNANLGGAPSAAALAISAGWPRLVLPGILAGIWGYVIGTPVGILVVEILARH
jgi:uncharacterized membrane protein